MVDAVSEKSTFFVGVHDGSFCSADAKGIVSGRWSFSEVGLEKGAKDSSKSHTSSVDNSPRSAGELLLVLFVVEPPSDQAKDLTGCSSLST